jgi:hypothetical protein
MSAMASGLWIGARLGDPAWTDPRAMLGLGGRSTAAAVLLVQAGAWIALAHVVAPAEPLPASTLVPVLAAGALFAALMLALTARALDRKVFTAD